MKPREDGHFFIDQGPVWRIEGSGLSHKRKFAMYDFIIPSQLVRIIVL
mgnify:CR=1 FL=1